MGEQCKQRVIPNERWGAFHMRQCSKSAWKDGFCKIHHPDSIKERDIKAQERYEERKKTNPLYLYFDAKEKIKELEIECERLRQIIHKLEEE